MGTKPEGEDGQKTLYVDDENGIYVFDDKSMEISEKPGALGGERIGVYGWQITAGTDRPLIQGERIDLRTAEALVEPVVEIEEAKGKGRITVTCVFPGFQFYSEPPRKIGGKPIRFCQLKIPKTGFINKAGYPLLPSFGRYLQIPFHYGFDADNAEHVKVFDENVIEIDNSIISDVFSISGTRGFFSHKRDRHRL